MYKQPLKARLKRPNSAVGLARSATLTKRRADDKRSGQKSESRRLPAWRTSRHTELHAIAHTHTRQRLSSRFLPNNNREPFFFGAVKEAKTTRRGVRRHTHTPRHEAEGFTRKPPPIGRGRGLANHAPRCAITRSRYAATSSDSSRFEEVPPLPAPKAIADTRNLQRRDLCSGEVRGAVRC